MAELDLKTINELALDPIKTISDAEAQYHLHIGSLAKSINLSPEVRIVLLAGPSGSGKTTTANLLADALRVLGEHAEVVSLDDFYKDAASPDYPRLENGERDYESPEALRLEEISEVLGCIADGRDFFLPKYDFKCAARVSMRRHRAVENGVVIIEGLHSLNPRISEKLPRERALKLFVSVSTNINDGGTRILSGRKLRFVRRMVRDSIYRGADAERTLGMWKEVLNAEDLYLYPYKSNADVAFDTFHVFEPSVMASFAKRLITPELAASNPYAGVVLSALERIAEIDPHLVPANSLIKEFIPGGIYESLY